jgi:hypothetical protein
MGVVRKRMIFFSVGLPGRFAEWCDEVTRRLAVHNLGPVELVALNTLEEVAAAAIRTSAPHLVASSRQPVLRLQTEIRRANRPFLIALGDPRAALHHLVQRRGHDLPAATRAVASSCAAMLTLAATPGGLALSDRDADKPASVARVIADHLGFAMSDEEIAVIAPAASLGDEPLEGGAEAAWWSELGERERALIEGAVQPYVRYFQSGELGSLTWEPELFFIPGSPMPAPANRVIDITGRARFLIYGPYISLPPGAWSARVVVGFSAEAAGGSFVIEVTGSTQLSYTRIEPVGEQVLDVDLQFTVENSVDQPIEVRIMNERAAFDGRLALGYVTITPRTVVRDETQQELSRLLRT